MTPSGSYNVLHEQDQEKSGGARFRLLMLSTYRHLLVRIKKGS